MTLFRVCGTSAAEDVATTIKYERQLAPTYFSAQWNRLTLQSFIIGGAVSAGAASRVCKHVGDWIVLLSQYIFRSLSL